MPDLRLWQLLLESILSCCAPIDVFSPDGLGVLPWQSPGSSSSFPGSRSHVCLVPICSVHVAICVSLCSRWLGSTPPCGIGNNLSVPLPLEAGRCEGAQRRVARLDLLDTEAGDSENLQWCNGVKDPQRLGRSSRTASSRENGIKASCPPDSAPPRPIIRPSTSDHNNTNFEATKPSKLYTHILHIYQNVSTWQVHHDL